MDGAAMIAIIFSVYFICEAAKSIAEMKYENEKRKDD